MRDFLRLKPGWSRIGKERFNPLVLESTQSMTKQCGYFAGLKYFGRK